MTFPAEPETPTKTAIPWRLAALAFVVVAAVLLAADWMNIAAASFETGDDAANSLLVQTAKSFRLLHGHYSRAAFYHPGPILLYVLAFGEAVFHDWLNIVTPFGGQAIAHTLINALWLALLFGMLVPLFGSVAKALLAFSTFCVITANIAPGAFVGMWFANVFYLPFAAFIVSLALMISGSFRYLPLLGICIGVLFNAHVSFVAMVTVALAGGVVANFLLFTFMIPDGGTVFLSRAFLRQHLRHLLIAAAIVLLCLAPLAIDTVLHWPGPILGYLHYARHNKPLGLLTGIRFLFPTLGGASTAIIGAIALVGAALVDPTGGARPLPTGRVAAIVAALGTVALAVLAYAAIGIDDTSFAYLIWFFAAVPAMAVAVIAVRIDTFLTAPVSKFGVSLLVVLALWQGAKAAAQPGLGGETTLPTLYAGISGLGPHLALDVDTDADFQNEWVRVVGLEIYGLRKGEKPFCVNRNWQFAFRIDYKCTLEDLAVARPVLLTTRSIPGETPLVEYQMLKVYDLPRP